MLILRKNLILARPTARAPWAILAVGYWDSCVFVGFFRVFVRGLFYVFIESRTVARWLCGFGFKCR